MRIFKCDLCFKPFVPNNKCFNHMEFQCIDINLDEIENPDFIENLPSCNYYNRRPYGFYHICPKCFKTIQNTLWILRGEKSEDICDSDDFSDELYNHDDS